MKKLTDIIKASKLADIDNEPYVPEEPIHFRMGDKNNIEPYVPDDPIHFRMGNKQNIKENEFENLQHWKRNWENSSFGRWVNTNNNRHLGEDNHAISKKLAEDHENHNMSSTHIHHITKYTQDSSDLNRHLISRHKSKMPIDEHFHDKIKNLDEITNHEVGHHLNLYSGVGFNPHDLKKSRGHMFLPAYTSLSHDKHVAASFSTPRTGSTIHHILHIHMSPHDKARHISGQSTIHGEHESILPRRTLLHVHHIPEDKTEPMYDWLDKQATNRHYNIWHARIINQG